MSNLPLLFVLANGSPLLPWVVRLQRSSAQLPGAQHRCISLQCLFPSALTAASFVTAAWGAGDTHMMTEEEMAARDEALMGEHSNPDSVAISIPEDFTKSVPPQVGLVIHPA